jgi:uncharacterized RDD family membrane protein YckC
MSQPSSNVRPSDPPIDGVVQLMTPERIVFEFALGGPFRRFVAHLLDLVVVAVMIVATMSLSMLLATGSAAGLGPALVAYLLLSWGYGAFCESVFSGQTAGKRAMGLRVLSDRGVPITAAQAILRNLVGAVDGLLPFCYLLGLSSMLLSARFQRLGDLAAGTMVIKEERRPRAGLVKIHDPKVQSILDRLPMRIAVGSSLARVLSDYVRRRNRFSRGLREEMAEPLAAPLRERFGLLAAEPADAVLCAIYHRVFLGE